MTIRNTWREFKEQYLYNIKDCNNNYIVTIHVNDNAGDIAACTAAAKSIVGTTLPAQFCEMAVSRGFGYARETVIGIICPDEAATLELIKRMKALPYRIDV